MIPSEGFEAILINAGLAGPSIVGWPIFLSRFGEDPDSQIALIDLPGRRPEVLIAQDYPGLQVLVRGTKAATGYPDAMAKARAVFNLFQAIPTVPANAQYPELVSCVSRHDVAPIGYDDQSRPILSMNFDLIVAPVVQGNRIY